MSNAVGGVGTLFRKYSSGWSNIAEVRSINGPTLSRETIEVTSLDSTGGYREYIPSFRDGGTVSLNMHFTRNGYEAMKTDYQSSSLVDYEIVLPDTEQSAIEFSGYVTNLPLNITYDDAITMDVEIKVTGEVTINSGSGSGAVSGV